MKTKKEIKEYLKENKEILKEYTGGNGEDMSDTNEVERLESEIEVLEWVLK